MLDLSLHDIIMKRLVNVHNIIYQARVRYSSTHVECWETVAPKISIKKFVLLYIKRELEKTVSKLKSCVYWVCKVFHKVILLNLSFCFLFAIYRSITFSFDKKYDRQFPKLSNAAILMKMSMWKLFILIKLWNIFFPT